MDLCLFVRPAPVPSLYEGSRDVDTEERLEAMEELRAARIAAFEARYAGRMLLTRQRAPGHTNGRL